MCICSAFNSSATISGAHESPSPLAPPAVMSLPLSIPPTTSGVAASSLSQSQFHLPLPSLAASHCYQLPTLFVPVVLLIVLVCYAYPGDISGHCNYVWTHVSGRLAIWKRQREQGEQNQKESFAQDMGSLPLLSFSV